VRLRRWLRRRAESTRGNHEAGGERARDTVLALALRSSIPKTLTFAMRRIRVVKPGGYPDSHPSCPRSGVASPTSENNSDTALARRGNPDPTCWSGGACRSLTS